MSGWISTLSLTAGLLLASAAHAQPTDEVAAGQALDRFHALAARADAAYFDAFAPDAVFIGADPAERWTVPQMKATFGPLFAAGKGFTYTPRQRHVSLTPDPCRCVAWFDELLDSDKYGASRSTGVLVKTAGQWKVLRYALAFTMPNDLAADLTAQIRAFEARK